MDYSTLELYLCLQKIFNYEPSLVDKIKSFVYYPFYNNTQLKIVVSLYLNITTKEMALKEYNHISLWDVSKITDLRGVLDLINL